MEKLFCRNVQLESLEMQNHRGHGLGLWLTKSIIEAHRGGVGVVSNGVAGKGCMFFIELPTSNLEYSMDTVGTPAEIRLGVTNRKELGTDKYLIESDGSDRNRWREREQLQKISNNMLAQTFQKQNSVLNFKLVDSKQQSINSPPPSQAVILDAVLDSPVRSRSITPNLLITSAEICKSISKEDITKSLQIMNRSSAYTRICALVVDDMRSNRKVLCKQLENLKCNIICTEVSDGSDAVQLIASALKSRPQYDMESSASYYDMIFMDSQMVTMDGAVAIEKIRTEHNYKGPIYGVTGDLGSVELMKEKGADEVYIKPIQISVLQTIVAGKQYFRSYKFCNSLDIGCQLKCCAV